VNVSHILFLTERESAQVAGGESDSAVPSEPRQACLDQAKRNKDRVTQVLCLELGLDQGNYLPLDGAIVGKNLPAILLARLGVDFVISDLDVVALQNPTPLLLRLAYGQIPKNYPGTAEGYGEPKLRMGWGNSVDNLEGERALMEELMVGGGADQDRLYEKTWETVYNSGGVASKNSRRGNDFILSEHWDSASLNNGFVFVKGTSPSTTLRTLLDYQRVMHYLPTAHDQKVFDGVMCYFEVDEPCTLGFGGRRQRTASVRRQTLKSGGMSPAVCPRAASLNMNLFVSGYGYNLDASKNTPIAFHVTGRKLGTKKRRLNVLLGDTKAAEKISPNQESGGVTVGWRALLEAVKAEGRVNAFVPPALNPFRLMLVENDERHVDFQSFIRRKINQLYHLIFGESRHGSNLGLGGNATSTAGIGIGINQPSNCPNFQTSRNNLPVLPSLS